MLCEDCMEAGCCGHVPARSGLLDEEEDGEKPGTAEHKREMESKKPSPGAGVVLLALSAGMVVWALNSCGVMDESKVVTEGDGIWSVILFVGAIIAFGGGIMMFFDRRPKTAALPAKADAQANGDEASE